MVTDIKQNENGQIRKVPDSNMIVMDKNPNIQTSVSQLCSFYISPAITDVTIMAGYTPTPIRQRLLGMNTSVPSMFRPTLK